jgi:hypothetical protein
MSVAAAAAPASFGTSRDERRVVWVALVAAAAAFALSHLKYEWQVHPCKVWKHEAPTTVAAEVCPDGMDQQIDLFAAAMRGSQDAAAELRDGLPVWHQSSTELVGVLGGALRLTGLAAPTCFQLVSAAASALLLVLAWRLLRDLVDSPRARLLAFLALLAHPATIRCLVRPQTDALYACAAMGAVAWGRRLARPESQTPARSFLFLVTQTATLFVKIHALVLPLLAPATAFLHGSRGRRLWWTVLDGVVVPLAIWAALFHAYELWPSIDAARRFKLQFYGNWDAWRVTRLLLLTIAPAATLAALGPRPWSATARALALLVVGYAALLGVVVVPPISRFVFPAIAPLVLLAAAGASRRFGGAGAAPSWRRATTWIGALAAWHFLLTALQLYVWIHTRWIGPKRGVVEWLANVVTDMV